MKSGRPPQWNPIGALGRNVWTDVVPVATKDRIVFPAMIRSHLRWLGETSASLLATIEPDHCAELLPWMPHGETMLAEVRSAIETAEETDKDQLTLAAMDRYLRLSVDQAGRSSLPGPLASFLDAHIVGSVRLVMRDDRLWLWSERRWDKDRTKRVQFLAGKLSSSSPPPTPSNNKPSSAARPPPSPRSPL
ncbi:MAG: hypothetical protein H6Q99_1830 [Proteobacteria bacterium]|nr:hypothetical protein [Pseudomonadota bacterium]